jgi:hypothetical protein
MSNNLPKLKRNRWGRTEAVPGAKVEALYKTKPGEWGGPFVTGRLEEFEGKDFAWIYVTKSSFSDCPAGKRIRVRQEHLLAVVDQKTKTLVMEEKKPAQLKVSGTTTIGDNYRERERIKKKIERHLLKFQRLPTRERKAILDALNSTFNTSKNDDAEKGVKFDWSFESKTIYEHETENYKLHLFIALIDGKRWNWGRDLKIKTGNKASSFCGAGLFKSDKGLSSLEEATQAAIAFTRKWIKNVVEENKNLSPQTFTHFYEWYNKQTQLSITEEPGQ